MGPNTYLEGIWKTRDRVITCFLTPITRVISTPVTPVDFTALYKGCWGPATLSVVAATPGLEFFYSWVGKDGVTSSGTIFGSSLS